MKAKPKPNILWTGHIDVAACIRWGVALVLGLAWLWSR